MWSYMYKQFMSHRGRRDHTLQKYKKECAKDVERAFGVLQSRWRIVKNACL
jgi:hypothetical protein